jgi:hypothetical protein
MVMGVIEELLLRTVVPPFIPTVHVSPALPLLGKLPLGEVTQVPAVVQFPPVDVFAVPCAQAGVAVRPNVKIAGIARSKPKRNVLPSLVLIVLVESRDKKRCVMIFSPIINVPDKTVINGYSRYFRAGLCRAGQLQFDTSQPFSTSFLSFISNLFLFGYVLKRKSFLMDVKRIKKKI